jgi:hypothetical protein
MVETVVFLEALFIAGAEGEQSCGAVEGRSFRGTVRDAAVSLKSRPHALRWPAKFGRPHIQFFRATSHSELGNWHMHCLRGWGFSCRQF